MLGMSPHVSQSLQAKVRNEADHLRRWLYWLKERDHVANGLYAINEHELDWTGGEIPDLIRASLRACQDCMTLEAPKDLG